MSSSDSRPQPLPSWKDGYLARRAAGPRNPKTTSGNAPRAVRDAVRARVDAQRQHARYHVERVTPASRDAALRNAGSVRAARVAGRPRASGALRPVAARAPIVTRRRLRLAQIVLGAALAGLVPAALLASPLLMVRHVELRGIAGLTAVEAGETIAAATVPSGVTLFRAPTSRMTSSIRRLPWVAGVTIARRLPGSLVVTLRAREAAAVAALPTGRWEIDADGVVIRLAGNVSMPVPEIALPDALDAAPGVRLESADLAGALAVAAAAHGDPPLPITNVQVDQSQELCLNMRENVAIRLGQPDDLRTKIELLKRIYRERPDIGTEVASIDLRCPDAPACIPRRTAGASPKVAAERAVGLRTQLPSFDPNRSRPVNTVGFGEVQTPRSPDPLDTRDRANAARR